MADSTDELLKRLNLPTEPPKPKEAPSARPAAPGPSPATAAPTAPASPSSGYKIPHGGDMRMLMGLGAARSFANNATNLGYLATDMSPQLKDIVGDFRKNYPAMSKRMDDFEAFGNSENQTFAEKSGYGMGEVFLASRLPGIKGASTAKRINAAINPPVYVRGPWGSHWATPAPTTATKWIERGGKAADAGAKGAQAGALSNPDDPKTGAIGGAVMGQAPGLASLVFTNPIARWTMKHALPYVLGFRMASTLSNSFGVPHHVAYSIVPTLAWRSSPVGKVWYNANQLFDSTGKLVADIPPGVAAANPWLTQIAGESAKAGGEAADMTVGEYARQVGERTRERWGP